MMDMRKNRALSLMKHLSLWALAVPIALVAPQSLLAQDEPISTNAKRLSQQILPTPLIVDAPKGDFERVAWCHGALTGHMEIADRIEEKDEVMKTIGLNYLKTYEAALTLSSDGQTDDGKARAEAERLKALQSWDRVRTANKDKQTGAYLNWSLPGDCERAAVAISGHPDLFKEMQDEHEAKVISDTLKPVNEGGRVSILADPKLNDPRLNNKPNTTTNSVKAVAKAITPKPVAAKTVSLDTPISQTALENDAELSGQIANGMDEIAAISQPKPIAKPLVKTSSKTILRKKPIAPVVKKPVRKPKLALSAPPPLKR